MFGIESHILYYSFCYVLNAWLRRTIKGVYAFRLETLPSIPCICICYVLTCIRRTIRILITVRSVLMVAPAWALYLFVILALLCSFPFYRLGLNYSIISERRKTQVIPGPRL